MRLSYLPGTAKRRHTEHYTGVMIHNTTGHEWHMDTNLITTRLFRREDTCQASWMLVRHFVNYYVIETSSPKPFQLTAASA